MEMPTDHLSIATAKRAKKLLDTSDKLSFNVGEPAANPIWGDVILFLISNEEYLCAVYCSPDGYLVELESDSGTEFCLVKNIRNLLQKLKSMGMSGYSSE